jgi:predicted solute-binding protein
MRVVIDDALVTSQLTMPLREGWATLPVPFEFQKGLTAADLAPDDIAFIPAGEATDLAATHELLPGVAVVYGNAGAIAMRAPVRPDGIDETPIRLYHASRTAELLIRALLRPFFGITASGFETGDDGDAQIVVVEGIEAITPPQAGFQEDLARAWFILTGLPMVSHVLVAPKDMSGPDPVVDALCKAVETGVERRRDVRVKIAEQAEVDRDRLVEVTNALRFQLDAKGAQSLHQLIARGSWGTAYGRDLPPPRRPAGV